MSGKYKNNFDEQEEFLERNLVNVVEENFAEYAQYILQSRAIPDIRDGLKPVQRRIIYSMQTEGNVYEKEYRKSAKTVGNVIGNFHPHSDSSIYDAMIRLSQDWKLREPLISIHGNNGSIDGDGAAAMRYCLTGDTIMQLENSKMIRIDELIPNASTVSEEDIDINVLDYDGKKVKAVKFFNSGKHPIKEIKLKNGNSIKGSFNHPILLNYKKQKNETIFEWVLLENIKIGDIVIQKDKGMKNSYSEVSEINDLPPENVYSIKVDSKDHSFLANGFINHNTEAKLADISKFLTKDLNKNTVDFVLNFDDTRKEPTVLPARFPNLLVNGTMGIAIGYATSVPPHNFLEVMKAAMLVVEKEEDVTFEELHEIIKGPDFPLGGIIEGEDLIKTALETGQGKIIIKSETEHIVNKNKSKTIIIKSIPYGVNKADLVRSIDEIRINKEIEGMISARDETDKNGIQIAIDLKQGVNSENIENFLFKNTKLQENFNYNMVVNEKGKPKVLGMREILLSYASFQIEILTRRTQFDLKKANERLEILEGLIKALSILDKVIKTIRASLNKSNAVENLVKEYKFTQRQAESIVSLQLYRLTNTDILELQNELEELKKSIEYWKLLLSDKNEMKKALLGEMTEIYDYFKDNKEFKRKTVIQSEIKSVEIKMNDLIEKKKGYISITKDGFIKFSTMRSYSASENKIIDHGQASSDALILEEQADNVSTVIAITNKGEYLFIPLRNLPEQKWKDKSLLISSFANYPFEQKIEKAFVVTEKDFKKGTKSIVLLSKSGYIKRVDVADLLLKKFGTSSTIMKLENDDKDEVISAEIIAAKDEKDYSVIISTSDNYINKFPVTDISIIGAKSRGVKAINVNEGAFVTSMVVANKDIVAITDNKTIKRLSLDDLKDTKRAKKGYRIIKEMKTPYSIIGLSKYEVDKRIALFPKKEFDEVVYITIPTLTKSDLKGYGGKIDGTEKIKKATCIY